MAANGPPPEADEDDERETELSSLLAIYPEILVDAEDPFSASLDIPVIPLVPLEITLTNEAIVAHAAPIVDTHHLEYLPPLHIKFTLPAGYPILEPPICELSTSPPWLPKETLQRLQAKSERLWEDFGHNQVLFTFVDEMRDAAQGSFGISNGGLELDLSQNDKLALLDFNIKAKKEAFDKETFDCGICLDPKKGNVCHRMIDCGHVFCVACLQDFYNNAITTGDLATVRCLSPSCAKEREAKNKLTTTKGRKPRKIRTFITPRELLQIPLQQDVVQRYVTLKHKADLESDKNTVYCPRKWCQGAARSSKYRKPEGLELVDGSDSESEQEDDSLKSSSAKNFNPSNELMRICEDCSFAFCSRCNQGWHGDYFLCIPRNKDGELTAEDKASLDYLRLHTTPCPTCSCPAQKTFGCNHMICFKCGTHFCYLCSAWLAPDNPYKHYNIENQGCYMRLWELEGGDGDDVGIGFAGGARVRHVDHEDEDENRAVVRPLAPVVVAPQAEVPQEQPLVVAAEPVREGPLVLRIDQLPARPQMQQQPALPPPPRALNRREAAAAQRIARRPHARAGRNRGHDIANDLANRPMFHEVVRQNIRRNDVPPGAPEGNQNDLIRDARRVLQDVAQERRQDRNIPQDPVVRQLLQRPPPAHENMNRQELLEQREWLERFMALAMVDEEDDWDSDEDDEDEALWAIHER